MNRLLLLVTLFLFAISINAQISKTTNLTSAGTLSTLLSAEELNTITNLTLTGIIDARDFKTMRDMMPKLAALDLRGVNITAYKGTEGTTVYGNNNYLANTLPEFAFSDDVTGKISLHSIALPISLTAIGQRAFKNCSGLTSITVFVCLPIELGIYSEVFIGWSKDGCTLHVPYGSASRYATANQWKAFTNIEEASIGYNLSSYSSTIGYAQGTTSTVDLFANVNWTVSVDQPWVVVTPSSGSGNQTLTITVGENTGDTNRKATITVSGVIDQSYTLTQAIQPQPVKTLEATPGALSSAFTTEVLNTISKLTLTGTIDARDFKTMRDKMPLLSELDLSGATIAAFNGTEGTYLNGRIQTYPANTIPITAFYYYNSLTGIRYGKASLTSVILPNSLRSIGKEAFKECTGITKMVIPPLVTSFREGAFHSCKGLTSILIPYSVFMIESYAFMDCSNLTSITLLGNIPISISSSFDVFGGVDKTACTLYVVSGTAALYAAAIQWKDFFNIVESPFTEVNQLSDDQQLTIYPNPTIGKVKLEFGMMPAKGTFITVMDMAGKAILKKAIVNKEEWIDLKGDPKGIYLISTNQKNSKVQRIVLK